MPSLLVVGCSEQIPNELRAYRLMGISGTGGMLLSRHGATYSATTREVAPYHEVIGRLLGLVLGNVPSNLRDRARIALVSRWNRNWGVEAEDLGHGPDGANDNGSAVAIEAVETSTPLFEPAIDSDRACEPRAAVAGS